MSVVYHHSSITYSRKGDLTIVGREALGLSRSGLFLMVQTISWVHVVPHFG